MATTNSIVLTPEYEDGTTRNYTFTGMDNNALANLKSQVLALNTTLADSVAGAAYHDTFVSEGGSPIKRISAAKYIVTEEQVIYNG